MAAKNTDREPIPAWYSVARQRNARRRLARTEAELIDAWWQERRSRHGRLVAETAELTSGPALAGLTDKAAGERLACSKCGEDAGRDYTGRCLQCGRRPSWQKGG